MGRHEPGQHQPGQHERGGARGARTGDGRRGHGPKPQSADVNQVGVGGKILRALTKKLWGH